MNILKVKVNNLLIFAAALLFQICSIQTVHAQSLSSTLTVTIERIRAGQFSCFDKSTFSSCGKADFFAKVTIDGTEFTSGVISNDNDTSPNFTFTKETAFDSDIPIKIRVFDSDNGFFRGKDDEADISPIGRDLDIVVNTRGCAIRGDFVNAFCTEQIVSVGTEGDIGAEIVFRIESIKNDVFIDFSFDGDADGLPTPSELIGIDSDGDGVIDVDLPGFGATSDHKDLFLELDWIKGEEPTQAAIRELKAAFAAAPINAGIKPDGTPNPDNPDGLPGIRLWVDTGALTDANGIEGAPGGTPGTCGDTRDNDGDGLTDADDPDCLVGDNLGGGNEIDPAAQDPILGLDDAFYEAKKINFNTNRETVFRYAISGVPNGINGGVGEVGGNDFIEFNHNAGTIMHEFGHTLNLRHGGDEGNNCKPNYISVMSYTQQHAIYHNILVDGRFVSEPIIDFSPPRLTNTNGSRGAVPLPTLFEDNLDERFVLDPTDPNNQFVFINGNGELVRSHVNSLVDWDGDGVLSEATVTVNIDTAESTDHACNNAVENSELTGHDDWSNISLPFLHFGDSANGAINPVTERELTLEEILVIDEALNTADVAIIILDNVATLDVGQTLVYRLLVSNNGPNPASQVEVVNTLPQGVIYQSDNANCVLSATELVCDLGELASGASREIAITVAVPADLLTGTPGSVTITNSATATNLAGPDPDLGNNSVSQEIEVVAQEWEVGVAYAAGDLVRFEGIIYVAIQGHTSQADWAPPIVPALWQTPTPATPPAVEWTPNTIYDEGSEVTFEGETFRARFTFTSFAGQFPPLLPALWDLVAVDDVPDPDASDAASWEPNTNYGAGDEVIFNGESFRARFAFTSFIGQEPPLLPALWERIPEPATETPFIEEWVPNANYVTGDEVIFESEIFRARSSFLSIVGHLPPLVPALWELVI